MLARQSEAHAKDAGIAVLGHAHAVLPDDLLNFHYGPVACVVALGWPGALVEELGLTPVPRNDSARFEMDPRGRPCHVLTKA